MKKKILFIYSTPKENKMYINTLPHVGLLTLVSFLESKGIKADVIDCNIQKFNISEVKNYDVIGFSTLCSNVKTAMKMAETIKKKYPKKDIIFGGPHMRTDPYFFIKKDFIDAVFVNESEYSLYEYLTKKNKKEVKGVYLKDGNNKTFYTGKAEWIKELDELPFPALHKIDIKKYRVPLSKKKPISNIITSRGCPFSCIFCLRPGGNRWRARSAENVVDEIEWQVKKFGVKEICIFDDNFTLDIKRAKRICDLIVERNIKVKLQFTNGIRADRVDKEFLEKFKKAGGWLVGVAPETGNKETLRKIKKGLSFDQVKKVVKWSKELGLITHSYFMVGFPWETKKHIEDTINFARELDTEIVQFCRVIPFPSTELWDMIDADMKKQITDIEYGMFYGDIKYTAKISDEELTKYIKRGYRSLFFKPKKILKLLKEVPIMNLYKLFKYSVMTRSI